MLPRVNKTIPGREAVTDRAVAEVDTAGGSCRELDRDAVAFCKHVGGLAPDHVCVMFRTQVADTGRRACEGCIIDSVLYRLQESIRDCVRVYNA